MMARLLMTTPCGNSRALAPGELPCEQFVLGSVAPFEPSVLIVRCGVALDHCVGIAKDHLKPHDEVRAAPGIRLINQAIRRWRVNKHHGILSMLDGHVDYQIRLTGVTTGSSVGF